MASASLTVFGFESNKEGYNKKGYNNKKYKKDKYYIKYKDKYYFNLNLFNKAMNGRLNKRIPKGFYQGIINKS